MKIYFTLAVVLAILGLAVVVCAAAGLFTAIVGGAFFLIGFSLIAFIPLGFILLFFPISHPWRIRVKHFCNGKSSAAK